MKKSTIVLLIVNILLLTALPATVAAAGKVTKVKFQGESALARFSVADPNAPCIQTLADVSAADEQVKGGPGGSQPSSEVFVTFAQFNNCTGELFIDAFGFAELPEEAFDVEVQLASAVLVATVEVFDHVSGTSFPADIQFTWIGTGPIVVGKSKFQENSPGCKLTFDSKGSFRDAEATATITAPEFFFSGPSNFAQLGSVKQGTMGVGCEPVP
jgi:hypothetical protein